MAKFTLGIANLFIGIVFFAWYGTEPIQKYFALPLYLFCGGLFLYESWRSREDIPEKPNILLTWILMALTLLLSILLAYLPTTYCYSNYTDEAGNEVNLTGLASIAYEKERQAGAAGIVTPGRVREAEAAVSLPEAGISMGI